jgi:fructuronate reductase
LHLGLGRFHRGHQAVYFEQAGWQVSAWSMRGPEAADRFSAEGYHVYVPGQGVQLIRCIVETGFPARDRERWERRWLDPDLALLTLTVTEKGYGPPLFQMLRENMLRRHRHGLRPLTVLSCDNLRGNGDRLRQGIAEAASVGEGELASYRFPNTVVDRIVPALSEESLAEFQRRAGLTDPLLIVTEPYSQWVIEDKLAGPRPPLEGVEWVTDAEPYESMKLHLLNLPHSFLAYAGLPRGHRYVHQAMEDLAPSVEALQEEASGQLAGLSRRIRDEYAARVRERFRNPSLPHSLEQIAMDGSAKLPQRLVPVLKKARAHYAPRESLENVLDAWTEFVANARHLDDPKARPGDSRETLLGMLGLEAD